MSGYSADVVNELMMATKGRQRPTGTKSFVRMFKPRFAAAVENGTKVQTIRPLPKRIPFAGDALSLRTWTGSPYRSKQRVLRTSVVRAVRICYIDAERIVMQPPPDCLMEIAGAETIVLRDATADRFAQADGFNDWAEMRDWFKQEHGLPFDGIVIYF